MKKHALRLLLFCFTLFIGVGVDWVYQNWPFFEAVGGGIGGNVKYQAYGSIQFYQSIDGVGLTISRLKFPSKESARSNFDEAIRDATEILEHNEIYDSKNSTLRGERIVGRYKSINDPKTECFLIIIRFDNNVTNYFQSTSLRYLLAFEEKRRLYTLGN